MSARLLSTLRYSAGNIGRQVRGKLKSEMTDSIIKLLWKSRASKWPQARQHQQRDLNVHEHVAYTLLKDAGIPTPPFGVAKTPEEAEKLAAELKSRDIVLKAQVLAGGRGKGQFKGSQTSGVVLCETPQEVNDKAKNMLGKLLVTKQTGKEGRICNEVMITSRKFPRREFYLAVMMERSFDGPVVIVSTEGGVNIEDTAASNPEAISYFPIDMRKGITDEQAREIVGKLGLDETNVDKIVQIVCDLYNLFIAKDALLLEINPFVEDICGDYFALDCKCNFDDSAEFRQKDLFAFRDWSQKDPSEMQANKYNLNYIALDGNIGCMVNGAGLAMATMDIIQLYGGSPANFLDVGGGASAETVMEAFKILSSDPKVDAILVNIFGGIMRCDIIAQGIIEASKSLNLKIPVVARLQGTKVDEARSLIANAKLKIIPIDDMSEAADASVKVAKMVNLAKSMNLELNISLKKTNSQSDKRRSKYSPKCD